MTLPCSFSRTFMLFVAVLFLTAGFYSCSDKHDDPGLFVDIDAEGWAYGQPLVFQLPKDTDYIRDYVAVADTVSHFPVADTVPQGKCPLAGQSRLELTIRHSDAYPNANLWLELSYPSADTVMTDTFNITLADRYGKWLGHGIGPSYQMSKLITTRHRLNDGAKVRLRHVMRIDTLRHIEQIGLKVTRR